MQEGNLIDFAIAKGYYSANFIGFTPQDTTMNKVIASADFF